MFTKVFYRAAYISVMALMVCCKLYAQPKDLNKDLYKASTIPDSIKENANDVIRYQSDDIIVKSPGHAIYKHYRLATILNEKGDHEAEIGIGYEKKYNPVSAVSIKVYNAEGALIKKYSKSDMYDRSAVDNETIVTDDRYLYLQHNIASYPVTIEISYEYDYNSFFILPSWHIQRPETAVQTSICKVAVNPAIGFRFQSKNISPVLTKGKEDELETYTWTVKNLKAEKPEEDAPDWRVNKLVNFTTNQFSFFGKSGDIGTWANYGKWVQDLNNDVCSLPEPRAEEIRKMTADLKTDKEKAKFLYNYLQQNMRYVSIQLGIGGFKPFPAAFVDQKKYGDCKALSNYMYALLKAVNIPSYYALINAGTNEEPADANFPYDPFNHAILCVPFKGDTTWLECTSTTQPFGKLGSFTENRRALLITEDGGKLVNTPRSIMTDNTFNSDVHITLEADGGAKAKIKILSTGEYRDSYIGMSSQKIDYQKELLIRRLHMKQPSVLDFKFVDNKDDVKEVDLDLEYDKFCDVAAGDKQFYRPRAFDLWYATVPVIDKRNADYYFDYPMQKTCNTIIDLPSGFEIESLPTNVSLKFTYGSYNVSYQYLADKNEVVSTTSFNLTNQVIPAAKYNEMQQYMDNIAKAQNKKLVIRRKAS
jgi:transglutaminase-like putative cysteine protease